MKTRFHQKFATRVAGQKALEARVRRAWERPENFVAIRKAEQLEQEVQEARTELSRDIFVWILRLPGFMSEDDTEITYSDVEVASEVLEEVADGNEWLEKLADSWERMTLRELLGY